VLGIDNIFVGVTGILLEDYTPQFTYSNKVAVKGILKNIGNVITGFTTKYVANGITYTKNYTGLNISFEILAEKPVRNNQFTDFFS
jgi:hypothetical protein